MDELAAARAFQLQLANRIYLCFEILARKAERKPMKTTISHGPELTRFLSFTDWSERGHLVYRSRDGGPAHVVHVDSRGRVCTRATHYLRARDEETFPITVYKVDED